MRFYTKESQADVRLLWLLSFCSFFLGVFVLGAADYDADLLEDNWESSHGLSTNAVAAGALRGWWQMDETNGTTVADRSTNGLALTIINAGPTDWQDGAFHNAVQFDGVARYLQAQTNAAYHLNDFTFSAWVNTGTNTTLPQVIAQWINANGHGWEFEVGDDGRAQVWFTTAGATNQLLASTNNPAYRIDDSAWYHVALTYEGANTYAKLYVDGELEAEGTVTGGYDTNVASFSLGQPGTTNGTFFSGRLDEVRLYGKVLSEVEVSQLPETYSDVDGDGLVAIQEQTAGTDPAAADTDNDGLLDGDDPYPLDANNNAAVSAGLQLWLRADAVEKNQNEQVSRWFDLSGNHKHADQTVSDSRPTWLPSTINAQPAVSFDGIDDFLQVVSDVAPFDQGMTVYIVSKAVMNNRWERFFGFGNGPNADNIWMGKSNNTRNMILQRRDSSGPLRDVVASGVLDASDYQLYSAELDASSYLALGVAGEEVARKTVAYSITPTTRSQNYIGKSNWASDATLSGEIAEILVFDRVLNEEERLQIEAYFSHRYGFTNLLTLPSFDLSEAAIYNTTQSVALFYPLAGTEIRYTTDGSTPNSSSTLYSAPIAVSATTTIKAKAFLSNGLQSEVAEATYVIDAGTTEVPSSGLQLWLRADAGVIKDGSGQVEAWRDLSGNGQDFTQTTAASKPAWRETGLGSQAALEFDGSADSLVNGSLGLGTEVTVIAVASTDTLSGTQRRIINNEKNLYLGSRNGAFASFYGNQSSWGITESHGSEAGLVVGQAHLLSSVNDGEDTAYLDGIEVGRRSNPMGAFADGMRVGRNHGGANQYWDGMISEVLVYDRALSEAELLQVETYMALRYGIAIVPPPQIEPDSDLISSTDPIVLTPPEDGLAIYYTLDGTDPSPAHGTLYSGPFTITANSTLKVRAFRSTGAYSPVVTRELRVSDGAVAFPHEGLRLWLRADQGVTKDGDDRISEWNDLSGNQVDFQQANADLQPVWLETGLGGVPAVSFDGNDDYLNAGDRELHSNSTGLTVFLVRKSNNTANRTMLSKFDAANNERGWAYLAQQFNVQEDPDKANSAFAASYATSTAIQINTGTWEPGGLVQTWVDGVVSGTATKSVVDIGDTNANLYLGCMGNLSSYFHGRIAEVMVFNRSLSELERTEVAVSLALRYGVDYELPLPTSPPVPYSDQATTQTIELQHILSGTEIRYTTDGSEPIAISALYQGGITLSETTTIKAKAFYNGLESDVLVVPVVIDVGAQAMPSDGLRLWLRADRGVVKDDSDKVRRWHDLSGHRVDFSQFSSNRYPTWEPSSMGSEPAIDFDGGNDFLTADDAELHSNSEGMTVLIVRQADVGANKGILSKFNAPEGQRSWMLQTQYFNLQEEATSNTDTSNAKYTNDTDLQINAGRWVPGESGEVWVNGELSGKASLAVTDLSDTAADLYLGCVGNVSNFFNGRIAEVLVYNRALSVQEQAEIAAGLALRYGADYRLPAPSHGPVLYSDQATSREVELGHVLNGSEIRYTLDGSEPTATSTLYTGAFPVLESRTVKAKAFYNGLESFTLELPVMIDPSPVAVPSDGLKLWLQAEFGVVRDGDQVVTWKDLSGNEAHFHQLDTNRRPIWRDQFMGGRPGVDFDGNGDYLSAGDVELHSNTHGLTVMVVRQAAATANDALISKFDAPDGQRQWVLRTINFDVQEQATSNNGANVAAYSNSLDLQIDTGIWSPSQPAVVWVNGEVMGTAASPTDTITDTDSELLLGCLGNFDASYKGGIAEILVYDRALTEAERVAISAQLALRFGIADKLPLPTVTPTAYSDQAASQAITFEHVLEGVEIRYTTDGTEPDANSTLYVGSFPVSATTTILAKAFYQGLESETLNLPVVIDNSSAAIPSDGLQLWLRADLGVRQDENGYVQQWNDLSGNQVNFTQSNTNRLPLWENASFDGQPAVFFDGSNDYLESGDHELHSNAEGLTVVVVRQAENTANRVMICKFATSNGGQRAWISRTTLFNVREDPTNTGDAYNASYQNSTDRQVNVSRWAPSGAAESWVDGSLQGTADLPVTDVSDTAVNLHLGCMGNVSDYFYGRIAEVLIYNRAVSDQEIQSIQASLAARYDSSSSLAVPEADLETNRLYTSAQTLSLTHPDPGAEIRYTLDGTDPTASSTLYTGPIPVEASLSIRARAFNGAVESGVFSAYYTVDTAASEVPSSGLKLWVRGDLVEKDGGDLVERWYDLSGQGNDALQTNGLTKPLHLIDAVSGAPVLKFDGSNDHLIGALSADAGLTVMAVASTDVLGGDLRRIISNEYNFFLGYDNGELASFYGDGAVWDLMDSHGSGALMETGNLSVLSSTNDGATDTAYLNGVQVGSRAEAFVPFADGYVIGRRHQDGNQQVWKGQIAEVLVFDRALTPTERTAVEDYLATRYGIATIPVPAAEAVVHELDPTAILSFTPQSDRPARIYYTTDGSDPTAGSTLYTGPVMFEEDATVRYIAISESNGAISSRIGTVEVDIDESLAWIPRTNMQLWLRADQDVQLTEGKVTQWSDLSGQGHHAQQTALDQQPALAEGAEGINGHPALTFDGVDDLLDLGDIEMHSNVDGLTIVAVYEPVGLSYP
ncbi:MAG: chitobiase/beta-hexosaminidase C-terminal domain-containing protein, partial [Verrucomicrobiota bacterium]